MAGRADGFYSIPLITNNFKSMNKYSILILYILSVNFANAEIKLPAIFGNGIVMQRDTKLNISGWASPNENVTLSFNGKKYVAKTDKGGNWTIGFLSQKAGGFFEMVFRG